MPRLMSKRWYAIAIMEMKAEECAAKLAVEKERRITTEAELRRRSQNILGSFQKFKENLLLHALIACDTFDVFKMDFDTLADKGELFMKEREDSDTADMAHYVMCDVMNSVPPSIIGGVTVASSTIEAGSFACANYFGGHDSSLVSLDFTAESFALDNCFKGHDSSLTNLNFTSGHNSRPHCCETYASSSRELPVQAIFVNI
ncbi:hypothetical protein GOBAR_DD22995 [Gossypium barbadense]|nr:hypothetical protein GOBAR_DD22995 [Gossypium barbadense]